MVNTSCRTVSEAMLQFKDAYYEVVCEGLNQPWSVVEGPDNMLWITNNTAVVSRFNPTTKEMTPLQVQLPFKRESKFAFFAHGLALHPQFATQPFVYLSYMYVQKDDTLTGHLDVIRLQYNSKTKSLINPVLILEDKHISGTMVMGGRLLAHDNYLFITTSDERENGQSQDISSPNGKILRYHLDGTIPEDNPFEGSPIYSYGHRNPQGLVMHDGKLYSSEHGPSNNDEINLIVKGGNYGWPLVSGWGDTEEEKELIRENNIIGPVYTWTPTIACSSIDVIQREGYYYFVVTTLKESDIRLMELKDEYDDDPKELVLLDEQFGRLRDVCVTRNGRVYVLTYNRIQKNFKYGFLPRKMESFHYDMLLEIFFDRPDQPEIKVKQL